MYVYIRMMAKKRLDLSKYDTINVGDETHEKVCQDLKLYFRKFNRKMKIHVKHEECTYQLPCYVLKVSFEICKQYLLSGPTFDQFQTKLEGYEVIPEILRILNISGTSQGLEKQLEAIFKPDKDRYGNDMQEWEYEKAAYATVVEISDLHSCNPIETLEKMVHEKTSSIQVEMASDILSTMIHEAVKLSWKMILLVPPGFIHFPEEFNEDWMDKKFNAWDEEAPNFPITIYSQPVFFYNALGQVGQKATVGNKLNLKNVKIVNVKVCAEEDNSAKSYQQLQRMPSLEIDEMYFFCDLCGSCIYGLKGKEDHEKLCIEMQKKETEIEQNRHSTVRKCCMCV